MRFVFGYDAKANLIEQAAEHRGGDLYHELVTRAERQIATTPRARPRNVKDEIVRERNYKVLRQTAEDVVEFSYRPGKCTRDYRVVALRKNISVERGENVLFCEYRYFFYITNDWDMTADEVIDQARQRCNQENLISQLKSGVRALHAPVNTLNANWAYMTMAALAWSLKAWCALLLPSHPALGRAPQRATPTPAHHGLPHLPHRLHQHPLPDHHHRPTRTLAHPRLQPMARSVLPPPRHPLTHQQPDNTTRPPHHHRPHQPAHRSDPEQRSDRVTRHPPTPTATSDRHPDPLLNTPTAASKPRRVDPGP